MQKLAFILGCGDTGMFMPDEPNAWVIGVNDAGRWGHRIDELLFINRPRHFNERALYVTNDVVSRLDIIKATPVKKIVTLKTLAEEWRGIFTEQVATIEVTRWRETFNRDQVYHTDNSPFSAMTYAVANGYTDIVLWGVDFLNHRYLKAVTSSPAFSYYAMCAAKVGVTIYKGHIDQQLNLPLWQK